MAKKRTALRSSSSQGKTREVMPIKSKKISKIPRKKKDFVEKKIKSSSHSNSVDQQSTSCDVDDLRNWLVDMGCQGIDDLEFIQSQGMGLGCFTKKDLFIGDTIFTVPQKCIVTFEKAYSSLRKHQQQIQQPHEQEMPPIHTTSSMTAELLIWIYMCKELKNKYSLLYPYLKSLDRVNVPTVAKWPQELQAALIGTNLSASVAGIIPRIEAQIEMINEIGYNSYEITSDELLWARSHYLSRRYPSHFGESSSDLYGSVLASCPKEPGLSNIGCLVPLLDILNHRSDVEWLKFEVKDDSLHVLCNHDRPKGTELYSNYGSQSNEMFLYAYGFAVEDNEDDAVAVRLMAAQSSQDGNCLGSFQIHGGGLEGIPTELWDALRQFSSNVGDSNSDISPREDPSCPDNIEPTNAVEIDPEEAELLFAHLNDKLQRLLETDKTSQEILDAYSKYLPRRDLRCDFIRYYRRGQVKVLQEATAAIDQLLDGIDGEGLEDEATEDEEEDS